MDTHIWVWWLDNPKRLTNEHEALIKSYESVGIGVSCISCWEVAKLVERNRLTVSVPIREWLDIGLAYPGMRLLELTPEVAVESTQLPGTFHKDPADQIIVATARTLGCPLITVDDRLRAYPHVDTP